MKQNRDVHQWSSYAFTPPLVLDHFWRFSGDSAFTPPLVLDHSENKGGKRIGTPLIGTNPPIGTT